MEYVLLALKILYDNPNNRGIPKPVTNLLSLRGIMAGTDGYSVLLLSRERYNERHLLKKKKKENQPHASRWIYVFFQRFMQFHLCHSHSSLSLYLHASGLRCLTDRFFNTDPYNFEKLQTRPNDSH